MAVSVDLIDALKRCLRAQELTYRELAARIRMSEAAVSDILYDRGGHNSARARPMGTTGMGTTTTSATTNMGTAGVLRTTPTHDDQVVTRTTTTTITD